MAKEVNISKSALGTYETGDFKDISPISVVKLAKFYGVTTDYLMGVSNIENRADAEVHELRLTSEALNVLKSRCFSGKLLSEVICHTDFPRLVTDMEIFVDRIANMQIDNLNYGLGTARSIVQKQYHPDENELFYRPAELGTVPADEYVSSVLRDDLIGILRDIREAHPQKAKDTADISPVVAVTEFRGNKKWSERMKQTFLSQGSRWTDAVEEKVKVTVANSIPDNLDQTNVGKVVIEKKSGFLLGIVQALELMIADAND